MSPEEKSEQERLRLEYLAAFRSNFEGQLQDLGLEKVEKPHCPSCEHKH